MKRSALILFTCLLIGCSQNAIKEQAVPVSKLNVESLLDSLDLNMDISGPGECLSGTERLSLRGFLYPQHLHDHHVV